MTDELDEILNIHTIDAGNRVLKLIDVNEAKQAIQALVADEYGKGFNAGWTARENAADTKGGMPMSQKTKDRIKELSNKENK